MVHWEQLAIPAGFPTGSLFGRAGRHINEVRVHAGVSRIDIDTVAMTIDIWGPTAVAVDAAASVYRGLFANAGGSELSLLQAAPRHAAASRTAMQSFCRFTCKWD